MRNLYHLSEYGKDDGDVFKRTGNIRPKYSKIND